MRISVVSVMMIWAMASCKPDGHQQMLTSLEEARVKADDPRNLFAPEAKVLHWDSVMKATKSGAPDKGRSQNAMASALLELGEEKKAIDLLEDALRNDPYIVTTASRDLGMAYLRLGERSNCISNHASSSCIIPLRGIGVHRDQSGSRKAIEVYEKIVRQTPSDLESRWLLNLAYMTLGEYPDKVPPEFLIPNMEGDTTVKINPFTDIASDLGLDARNQAGGAITDDFDNDGYLDIITSSWSLYEPMHYFHNNADGTFSNWSDQSGLSAITGGLNISQADYNNDGFLDILVLRGAWKGVFGNEPNSLLRNNGDGTFTDVTIEAGLFSKHPTQTATWNDFNNDGWLDLFVGNESTGQAAHASEFFMSNGDGTFREVAQEANCKLSQFVKGVTSGDYDNDGWKDIFISTMDGKRMLLRNNGVTNGQVSFTDVSAKAGISHTTNRTFPTWFFDYDNDGWLDIFVCDYTFTASLASYAAAEKLGQAMGRPDKIFLYHNNHDGTFTNVAPEAGLNKVAFAMGSNFGDIDNDGYLDIYLGTGNPYLQSLVPNKMFRNLGGKAFADVTASARVGHLQKGHAVAFADFDHDGDQDIYEDMGGAFAGDSYANSFYLNPGQGNNHWINILLEGKTSNRSAIGSTLKIVCTENGVTRNIYRNVNSGGSFGSSPLRREIGLGQATKIDVLEIRWHGSGKVQVFKNIQADQFTKITEGNATIETRNLKRISWTLPEKLCDPVTTANN